MSGTITTGNIPRLLQEGLDKVFGQVYDEHPVEWMKLFGEDTSKKAFELDQLYEGFGIAREKPEGQDIEFDSASQGYTPEYRHLTFAKGFILTKEAMNDELYGVFKKKAGALAFAMRQAQEVNGANVYNRGFDSNFPMTGGDGQSLFSTAHPLGPNATGTFSNRLAVGADLSEASLEDLLIQIGQAEDYRGLKISIIPECLVVPVPLAFETQRIMGSVLQNDTANNAVNAIRDMNAIPGGHVVNHYLTSNNAWFIKTIVPEGMKYYRRQAVEYGEDMSFSTGNARYKADERYSYGWSDPKGAYGSPGV